MAEIKLRSLVYARQEAKHMSRSVLGFVTRIEGENVTVSGLDGQIYTEEIEHLEIALRHNLMTYLDEVWDDPKKTRKVIESLIWYMAQFGMNS